MPTNGEGYGLDYWGVGPWGVGAVTGTFSLESIFANSERTIRVTFTEPAMIGTPLKAGAGVNLATWSATADGVPLTILAVRAVDDAGRQFELYTLQKFPPVGSTLAVSFPTILDDAGSPLVGASSGTCAGARLPLRTPLLNRIDTVDLANVAVNAVQASGVYPVMAGGDYLKQSGDALLAKLIYRRMMTVPGEFSHIPPENFGLGLRPKEVLLLNDVPALRAEVERQVMREPDVEDVRASVQIDDDGVVFIQVSARRRSTGGPLLVSAPLSGTVVQL